MILLHIFSWFWQWNNFENRLIFDEVKACQKTVPFLGHPVYTVHLYVRSPITSRSKSRLGLEITSLDVVSVSHRNVSFWRQLALMESGDKHRYINYHHEEAMWHTIINCCSADDAPAVWRRTTDSHWAYTTDDGDQHNVISIDVLLETVATHAVRHADQTETAITVLLDLAVRRHSPTA